MITLKDIIDLKPYCRLCVHNHKDLDFIDLYNHPDRYVISDMNVYGDRLDVLVNPIDGFTTKFNSFDTANGKYVYESANIGMDKLFNNDTPLHIELDFEEEGWKWK